jgi:glycerol-3-phosphate dehydrogenase subunit C
MKHQNGVPLRDRLIPLTTLEGRVLSPIAPLANWGLNQKPILA